MSMIKRVKKLVLCKVLNLKNVTKMLWIFFLHSTIWVGFELISFFMPPVFDTYDQLAIGIPFGITLVSWFFYIIKFFSDVDKGIIILVTIILYSVSIIIHLLRPREFKYRKIYIHTIALFIFFILLVTSCLYFSLLYRGTNSAGTVFSDLPVHLGLITSFAYGVNSGSSRFTTPFFSGSKLCYPFIPDFYSSILVLSGCSLRTCVALPSILMFLSLFIALHSAGKAFSPSIIVPELTIIFFFFAGGEGWKYLFVDRCRKYPGTNATHQLCDDVYVFWINSFLHFLLPQRSALFSLSLDIYIMLLMIHFCESKFKNFLSIFFAGMLMGFLPMISAHSYISVGEYAIFLCIITFPWFKIKQWALVILEWGIFALISILIAAPQIFDLLSGHRSKMMSIEPVWRESSETRSFRPIRVWWNSLSTFIALALFGVWFTMNKRQNTIYLPSLFIWIISNFLRYQPGAMDNTKVFFPGWMVFASAAVAHFFSTVFHTSYISKKYYVNFSLVIVCLCFLVSSIFGIYSFFKYPNSIIRKNEKELGDWCIENTSPSSVFLGSWWHSSTIMMLAGRSVTMAYPGWAWTHGFDDRKRQDWMNYLASNLNNATIFMENNIKYILQRPDDFEKGFYFYSPSIKSKWMEILDLGKMKLYRMIEN